MDWCVGLQITSFYCNRFFGRDYELAGSVILHAGDDYLVIRKPNGEVVSTWFEEASLEYVQSLVENWTE
ncbi:hypothetical protein IMZ31_24360 (plasmid) [Pontibacillus sp. ALD_SL1]|uniref:hypothetical protein n=1 Tax=Pontibacillus sp. ALD_SL1 TaxID=2777185 RepID=UPI001A96C056|nr:hypothetical protein [Pontibacillus sp. ALD_SL1]QST02587.1 hypothetical protein IMZ31_24360 [Pontibacillus sp. ALD_SL1]